MPVIQIGIVIAMISFNLIGAEDDAPRVPTDPDWLERQNELMATIIRVQEDVTATIADEALLRDIRALSASVKATARAQQAERNAAEPRQREALEPAPTADGQAHGPALYTYWHYQAPRVPQLFPLLTELRDNQPSLPIYTVHIMPPGDWQLLMLEVRKRTIAIRQGLAQDGADPQAVHAPHQAFFDSLQPLQQAQLFHQSVGLRTFRSMAPAIRHQVGRIPTFRYRSSHGRLHALTGIRANLDLAGWMTRCEAWDSQNASADD